MRQKWRACKRLESTRCELATIPQQESRHFPSAAFATRMKQPVIIRESLRPLNLGSRLNWRRGSRKERVQLWYLELAKMSRPVFVRRTCRDIPAGRRSSAIRCAVGLTFSGENATSSTETAFGWLLLLRVIRTCISDGGLGLRNRLRFFTMILFPSNSSAFIADALFLSIFLPLFLSFFLFL